MSNEFIDQAAVAAMKVLLEHDLQMPVERQSGVEWVAKLAFETAYIMHKVRKQKMLEYINNDH